LQFDKIVFVAGLKSSNGKVLFDVCKDNNTNTYFVSSKEEVSKDWFNENDRIGICGATSTPQWQMEDVRNHILAF
jgi:4-hydroxy-3-methylbut-2-enyl diphosphate reductase